MQDHREVRQHAGCPGGCPPAARRWLQAAHQPRAVSARSAAGPGEALELAPLSKLLYASDAVRTPELYLLAARWWRDALAEVLGGLLTERAAQRGAELILRENARALYRL